MVKNIIKSFLYLFLSILLICSVLGINACTEEKKETEVITQKQKTKRISHDWKTLANNLLVDYQGKILSIEQLNSFTCWAILSSNLSNSEAVKVAKNIGYYIRNSTGGIHGETPSIHVFLRGKHVAIARPSGINYHGEIKIKNWHTSDFGGQYRP